MIYLHTKEVDTKEVDSGAAGWDGGDGQAVGWDGGSRHTMGRDGGCSWWSPTTKFPTVIYFKISAFLDTLAFDSMNS
ncbi:unnamed protein product [Victoria cruziana]